MDAEEKQLVERVRSVSADLNAVLSAAAKSGVEAEIEVTDIRTIGGIVEQRSITVRLKKVLG